MVKRKKISIIIVILLLVISIIIFNIKPNKNNNNLAKQVNIEEILRTEAYSYLPERAKDYIREVYNETGEVLLTEKNKEKNREYLNPNFIEYLKKGETQSTIPSATIIDYIPLEGSKIKSPSDTSYDLRDVDGKNFVTPWKNQGSEGLCWAYAANATIESHLLVTKNKSYDNSAVILSEQQLDYATASNNSAIKNILYNNNRELSSGGDFIVAQNVLLDGLATVPKSWDDNHSYAIRNKSFIDPVDVYNFNNSLYELNGTIHFPVLDFDRATEEEKTNYINDIKTNIVEHGGAWVSSDTYGGNYNYYDGQKIKVMNQKKGTVIPMNGYHALQIIGWDDNIEYTTCNKSFNTIAPDECNNNYRTGQGVWILKNSWGEFNEPLMYLAYESYNSDIYFLTNLKNRSWDNYYYTDEKSINTTRKEYTIKADKYVGNEKINEIKANFPQDLLAEFYAVNDSTEQYIGSIQSTYAGYYTLDVSSKNIDFTNTTKIRAVLNSNQTRISDVRIYTTNNSNEKSINTLDYNYRGMLNNNKFFKFEIISQTKNIPNNTPLTLKIKNSNGEYISEDAYTFTNNNVYANVNNGLLTINSDYFSKGTYTGEMYYDNNNYSTFSINIITDLLITEGDGSSSNPWQLEKAWQFDLIRDYKYDSFLLKDDIDFAYDTKNSQGLLYNNGYGFEAIEEFGGYLNGNGHSLKNLYSKAKLSGYTNVRQAGIFQSVNYYNCYLDKCGIENIKIETPDIIGSFNTGGFIDELRVDYYDSFTDKPLVIKDIAVIGGSVKSLNLATYNVGGVIGLLAYADEHSRTITISNLYSSATVTGNCSNSSFLENIGGIIGSVSIDGAADEKIILNNLMNQGKVSHGQYYGSIAGIMNVGFSYNGTVELNNVIDQNGEFISVDIPSEVASENDEYSLIVNNIYSTSQAINTTGFGTMLKRANNKLENKDTIKIANADYSRWTDFSTNWVQYNEDGVNRIPILRYIPFEYFHINNKANIAVGENLTLKNLAENTKFNSTLSFAKSCNIGAPACSNTTDTTIVSFSDTYVKGLKIGKTYVIAKNLHDGYLGAIEINVTNQKRVTYNANGGTGTMEEQLADQGSEIELRNNSFTRTDYDFKEWNTKADGTGTSYEEGQTITLNNNLTLYAIWQKITHTVSFKPNGGTGTMEDQIFTGSETKTLSPNTFTKEDYEFNHWNTNSNDDGTSYSDEQSISINQDLTLYAIYNRISYNVIFELDGGTGLDPTSIYSGETLTRPTNPVKTGYIFVNWYQDEQLTTLYDFSKPVKSHLTLYAKWRKPILTWDVNSGITETGFENNKEYLVGTTITLSKPDDFHIKAPNGKEFDAYEIAGARYIENQEYTILDNTTIKCLWKEKTIIPPIEHYSLSFKKTSTETEKLPYDTDLTSYINSKKEVFVNKITEFTTGKENVSVSNYNDLFTTDKYAVFDTFKLVKTEEDSVNNTITYKYELNYKEINPTIEKLINNIYTLNKIADKKIELLNDTDFVNYIAKKKNEFSEKVKNIDINELFIIDTNTNTYQYAEYVKTEKVDSSETNNIVTNKYTHNYNLVTVVVMQEYVLTDKDNTIRFIDEIGKEFIFSLKELEDKEKVEELKKNRKDDTLLNAYEIYIKYNGEYVHKGPFKLRLKLSEDMKNYDSFFMISIDSNEDPIEFKRDGDYIEGTLNHLSEYMLVGKKSKEEIKNPITIDKPPFYIIILSFIIFAIILFKKNIKGIKYLRD